MHAPGLAAGNLFEVRVVQNDVGRDLLAPRLIPTPGPQMLEELRIYRIGGSAGRPVRHLYRTGPAVHDGDARLGGRPGGCGSVGSVFREDRGSVGLSEAHVAAEAGGDLLCIAEVPEEVLPTAGFEGDVSLDAPDLVVGRPGPALEACGYRPPASFIEALPFEPDVHEGALGQSLHELVRHELEEGRLSDDGPQARATSQLQQGYRPAAR